MKKKMMMCLAFLGLALISFAQVTVDVFINGIKSGQYKVKIDSINTEGISYKKRVFKNTDKLTVELKGSVLGKGYYRKIDVLDTDQKVIFTANETVGADGQFILSDDKIFNRLTKGRSIILYLQMTPANTKSKLPSKRIYVGTISRSK